MAERSRLLMLAGYVVALAWIAFELQWEVTPATTASPAAGKPLADLEAPDTLVAELDAFDEIVQRPLFAEGRRPPGNEVGPEEIARAAAKTNASNVPNTLTMVRLSAILKDGGHVIALVDRGDDNTVRLQQGGLLEGWEVKQIHDDRVILVQNGQRQELLLHRFDPPPPIERPAVRRAANARPRAKPERTSRREGRRMEDDG